MSASYMASLILPKQQVTFAHITAAISKIDKVPRLELSVTKDGDHTLLNYSNLVHMQT